MNPATALPPIITLIKPILLRPQTLARKLDISTRTLRVWMAAGIFPPPDIRENRKVIFWRIETVIAWADRRQVETTRRFYLPQTAPKILTKPNPRRAAKPSPTRKRRRR